MPPDVREERLGLDFKISEAPRNCFALCGKLSLATPHIASVGFVPVAEIPRPTFFAPVVPLMAGHDSTSAAFKSTQRSSSRIGTRTFRPERIRRRSW